MKKTFVTCLMVLLTLLMVSCGSPAQDGAEEQSIVNPVDLTMEIAIDVEDAQDDGFDGTPETAFIAEEGATVLEATQLFCMANDISLTVDKDGTYVTEMGGLSEGDYAKTTGWIYEIDGESPTVGAAEMVIEKNQKILWKYIDISTISW